MVVLQDVMYDGGTITIMCDDDIFIFEVIKEIVHNEDWSFVVVKIKCDSHDFERVIKKILTQCVSSKKHENGELVYYARCDNFEALLYFNPESMKLQRLLLYYQRKMYVVEC